MRDDPAQEQSPPPVDGESNPGVDGATDPSASDTERASYTRPTLNPPPERPAAAPQRRVSRPRREAAQRSGRRQSSRGRRNYSAPRNIPPPAPVQQYPAQAGYGSPRRESRRRRTSPRESGLYFPWWSLVLLVVVVGIVAFGIVLAVGEMTEPNTPGNQPARVRLVTSQPTLSQDFLGGQSNPPPQSAGSTPIPPAQPSPTVALPTPNPRPSLPPGEFLIGAYVQVVGVDTSGLNIRSSPGYGGTPRFLATEGEEFVLVDGPQTVDDLEWWRVEDPDDSNRFGWAARNFLTVVSP